MNKSLSLSLLWAESEVRGKVKGKESKLSKIKSVVYTSLMVCLPRMYKRNVHTSSVFILHFSLAKKDQCYQSLTKLRKRIECIHVTSKFVSL